MTRLPFILSVALSLSMTACAMEVPGDEEPDLEEAEQLGFNQLGFNQLGFNGITGSFPALQAMSTHALASATFDADTAPDALVNVLNNADTRFFMKYLVGCALSDDDEPVEFTDFKGKLHTFYGSFGLCSDWADGAPDADCQEIVSACLIASNNAYQKSKMVSMRGFPPDAISPLPTEPTVHVKPTDIAGATIASFRPCGQPTSGAERNCGYDATSSLVGTCTPGKLATLSCNSLGDGVAARICDGIEGCNAKAAAALAQNVTCTEESPTLAFTCGKDGAFAAMLGPIDSDGQLDSKFKGATGGVFPASERQVLPLREGAFYGNLLNPGAHSPDVNVTISATGNATIDFPNLPLTTPLYVYGDAWACHDQDWLTPTAYMQDRLCAIKIDSFGDQAKLCVAHPLGACFGGGAGRCSQDDALPVNGDRDFGGGCLDASNVPRDYPVTVMLHQPCDLLPPGSEANCQRRAPHQ